MAMNPNQEDQLRHSRLKKFLGYGSIFNGLVSIGVPISEYFNNLDKFGAYTSSQAFGDSIRNTVIGEAIIIGVPAGYFLYKGLKRTP